ncbi:MAG: uracil phosphoribosyltransferase [Acidobacteriota bacterium]|nr:uracil phosphoribosyltransferase [Acidobacteriota bacterium]
MLKKHEQYPNFYTVEHPLIKHKLFHLRDKTTSKKKFKELAKEISLLLAYEATSSLPLTEDTVETPLESMVTQRLAGKKSVILPILRAGLGMVDGFLELMPGARIGHIGLFRDEDTLAPQKYYFKIPGDHEQRLFLVLDPMLATGGSASAAVAMLKEEGIRNIKFVCLVAAPEGVNRLNGDHPDVPVYAASLDRQLNSIGYILPGLGDAGDRLFGTR